MSIVPLRCTYKNTVSKLLTLYTATHLSLLYPMYMFTDHTTHKVLNVDMTLYQRNTLTVSKTCISWSNFFPLTHCRCRRLQSHVITHNDTSTLDRTPLDKWSARCWGLYWQQQTAPPTDRHPTVIESANPESQWPQTYAIESAATEIGRIKNSLSKICSSKLHLKFYQIFNPYREKLRVRLCPVGGLTEFGNVW